MVNLAGKYASNLVSGVGRRPIPSALAGAALAGGLATAGNLVSGEAAREESGRLAAEALGAAALGGIYGARLPATRAALYGGKRAVAKDIAARGAGKMATGAGVEIGNSANMEQLRNAARLGMNAMNYGAAAGTGLGMLGAGAIGGMVGGGVSNLAQMVGVPGFQQQAMDPEMYGSSNTVLARSSVPTLQY